MKPKLGSSVVYCDPKGIDHVALVTCVWSDTCINVVYVSDNPAEKDDYGWQIKRETSVTHATVTGQAHGRYWRHESEPANEYKPPQSA